MNFRRTCTALTAASLILMPAFVVAQTPPPAVADAPADVAKPVEAPPVAVGIILTQRPVHGFLEARDYAGEWIRAGGLTELAVGRVRRVGGLFIVDLVAQEERGTLQNQLLVRGLDGLGTLVYPANINGPVPADVAAGMAGLEGMSGMSGLRGATQRKNTLGEPKAISIRNGRRAVDAWLLQNGLHSLYAGKTSDLGGVFVTDIVDARGAKKNQAVLRKADGFTQMVHPVGSLSKMAEARQRAGK